MFWLIVYLFTPEGEFLAKDVYESASEQQCVEFAGQRCADPRTFVKVK
jgi:hypothetical protein